MDLGALAREARDGATEMREMTQRVEAGAAFGETLGTWANDLLRQWNELRSRTQGLVREVEGWVGPLTQDQQSRRGFYREMVGTLERETAALAQRIGGGPAGGSGP